MLSTAAAASSTSLAAFPTRARRRRRRVLFPVAAAAADQFATSSSIADYLRYRRPGSGDISGGRGGGELQTAVVRYEKRLPWSLLHPFLRVSSGLVVDLSFCFTLLAVPVHVSDTFYQVFPKA
jgi:hypothetical protein